MTDDNSETLEDVQAEVRSTMDHHRWPDADLPYVEVVVQVPHDRAAAILHEVSSASQAHTWTDQQVIDALTDWATQLVVYDEIQVDLDPFKERVRQIGTAVLLPPITQHDR